MTIEKTAFSSYFDVDEGTWELMGMDSGRSAGVAPLMPGRFEE